jgi:hypothetical protein
MRPLNPNYFAGKELLEVSPLSKDLPGIEMLLAFDRMSEQPAPRDVSGTLKVDPKNGPHGFRPVYFFGRQTDDAKVWTSAMFIEFKK